MAWISEAQKHYEEYVDYYASLLEDYVDNHILELAPAYGQLQEAAVAYLEEVTKKYVNEQNPDFVPTRRWAKKIQEEYLTKIDMRNCFLWGKYYSVYFGTGREVCGNCTEPYGFWRIGYYS